MKSIYIVGANGLLGSNLSQYLQEYNLRLSVRTFKNIFDDKYYDRNKNFNNLNKNIKKFKPDIIINTVGLANVDDCEKFKKKAKFSNVTFAVNLSKIAKNINAKFIHISTDHLFNDNKNFYSETDKPHPLNYYAKTKLEAEKKILNNNKDSLILRTNFFDWGPLGNPSFIDKIYNNLIVSKEIHLFNDVYFNPLSIKELSKILEKIFLKKNITGILNVTSSESISKYEFGLKVAKIFSFNKNLIKSISKKELIITRRPNKLTLSNKKIKKILNLKFKTTNEMLKDLKKIRTKNKNIIFLPYGKHFIDKNDIDSVIDVLKNKSLTQGKKIDEFENKISEFVGSKYAVAVSSCTAGLHLSSIVSGLNKNKNFLTSPISFVSTSNAGIYQNSNPIFADINKDTLNISTDFSLDILKKNKVHTILPVHFSGFPADMKKISKNFRGKSIIIEDAAHALGARYSDGAMVGSCKYSDMCVFSFHPVKLIASGEGGIVTTNDKWIYTELLKLRSHGINKLDETLVNKKLAYDQNNNQNIWYYEMQKLGFHYRLTDIQSSLAISQLSKIKKFLNKRLILAKRYSRLLKNFRNCKPAQNVDYNYSANHLFVVKINFDNLSISRNDLMIKLRDLNIGSQVHYLPIFLQPYYKKFKFKSVDFPNSMEYYNSCLSLPLYYNLEYSQQDYIVDKLYELIE
tara:strand:+ start:4682 stop:6739 length:2058 start_codon:yes stop_codon:yes gene_type:complete